MNSTGPFQFIRFADLLSGRDGGERLYNLMLLYHFCSIVQVEFPEGTRAFHKFWFT